MEIVWLFGWQPQRVEKGRTDRSCRHKHTDIIQGPPVLSYLQFHVASLQVSNEINDLDCHLKHCRPHPVAQDLAAGSTAPGRRPGPRPRPSMSTSPSQSVDVGPQIDTAYATFQAYAHLSTHQWPRSTWPRDTLVSCSPHSRIDKTARLHSILVIKLAVKKGVGTRSMHAIGMD